MKQLNFKKITHLKSLTHIQYEKSNRINHIKKNPNFYDIDKRLNNNITNHNKQLGFYLFKCEYKLGFNI